MSYILDALKKAEAERRQGSTGAGSSTSSTTASHMAAPSVWRTPWPWLALTIVASLCIGLIWFRTAPLPQQPQQQQGQAQGTAATQNALPPVAQAPAPNSTPAPAAPAAPAASTPPPAKETLREPEKAEPPAATAEAKPKPVKRKEPPKPAPREEAKPAAPPPPSLRELPESIQSQIPQYTVGGYIYSGSKADRSVLINGRLMHEGDDIAPGLKLESMTPKGMILNFNGTRFRAGY